MENEDTKPTSQVDDIVCSYPTTPYPRTPYPFISAPCPIVWDLPVDVSRDVGATCSEERTAQDLELEVETQNAQIGN